MSEIKHLSNLSLENLELRNAKIHVVASDPNISGATYEGRIIYNSTENVLKFHNGASSNFWVSLSSASGDITSVEVTAGAALVVGSGSETATSGDFAVTLDVNVDDTTIEINGDALRAKTASIADGGTGLATADQIHAFVTGFGYIDGNESISLSGDVSGSGTTSITTTIGSAKVVHSMLNDDIISGQDELGSGDLVTADEFMVSDDGTIKRISTGSIAAYMQANLTFTSNTDVLQTISADTTDADRFITSVASASGAQQGLSHSTLKYNPSSETLKVTNLVVSGTSTTINTETIALADNIITLNSNATGSPSENAGLEIERGSGTNVVLRWNESTDRWEFTNDGSTFYNIPISTEYNNYVHPTEDGDDLEVDSGTLSGATVISDLHFNVTTNTLGHVTDTTLTTLTTRDLTLSDLGYSGDSAADNYGGWVLHLNSAATTNGAEVASGEVVDFLSTTTEHGGVTITNPAGNDLEFNVVQGSTTKRGALELATTNEAETGTDTSRAVTPAGVAAAISKTNFAVVLQASESSVAKSSNTYTVTHGLNTRDVIVQVYDIYGDGSTITYDTVHVDVERATVNTIKVLFAASVTDAHFKVLITKVA
ncbi:MAG: hypothetical protein GOVbin3171_49 [Prokaryotic dsDNA virus sp.]|nr:MAG: hypothetical protein GOVbin3171_49 [Prokaryotic dsDNA virus sp.]|tara:strand:- start:3349 stop:5151 length:1803 start_codon:yes stop_codon:yes gene_type:complete